MMDIPLTAEQEGQAQRLFELFQQPLLHEARRLARLVASKSTRWANPQGPSPSWQARQVAQEQSLVELGIPLRRQGGQVGMDQAQRGIAWSDGGNGLEDFLRSNFGRVDEVILDFWQAAEQLGDLAKALHPAEQEAAESWRQHWCHRLKHEGGLVVLAERRSLAVRRRAARACRDEVVRYFAGQVHRMDYPRQLAQGWQIGWGPVESACKRVVGLGMKGGGMRWGEEGADAVAHQRALFRGEKGQWESFWNQNYPSPCPLT